LYYVLRYVRRMLQTPVPANIDGALTAPPAPIVALMDRLVERSLLPVSGRYGSLGEESARLALYIRSHWLRMPPRMLAAHLTHKALRRWNDDADEGEKK
jgi:hypothetical protein